MTAQDAKPPEGSAEPAPCPKCELLDQVTAVPEVYAASTSAEEAIYAAKTIATNKNQPPEARTAARARLRETRPPAVPSRALAPRPPAAGPLPAFGLFIFGLIAATLAILGNHKDPAATTPTTGFTLHSTTFAVVSALLAALCLIFMIRALVRNHRIAVGLSAAEAVWRCGWYCGRCTIIYFQPGQEPPGAIPGRFLMPGEFRRLVWQSGGYLRG